MPHWKCLHLACAMLLWLGAASAQPRIPAGDDEILERLPAAGAERGELRALRTRLGAEPDNGELAMRLARRYLELGRADSDPRYYGHAEAVLQPWTNTPHPLPEALLLRATVLQNRHVFEPALADLDAALRLDPRLAPAWLTRAAIQEARGDYAAALQSCMPLARIGSDLAAGACLYSALSLSGQAEYSYRNLSTLAAQAGADPAELLWVRGILAELAERLGQPDRAERQYRAALALGLRSPYLSMSYADFLLDQGRHREVLALLDGETRADPLLLRLALAEKHAGGADFQAHAAALQDRFEASRLRGDATHQGDEARFVLYVRGDARAALELARSNWAVQREPRDARILLEAALAAGQAEAAQPVLEFLQRTRLEDARLQPLVLRVKGGA